MNSLEKVQNWIGTETRLGRFSGEILICQDHTPIARLESSQLQRPLGQRLYRIGCISKQMTAAAILTLAGRAALNLDDPLSRYFQCMGSSSPSVRHALNLTAGFKSIRRNDSYQSRAWTAPFPVEFAIEHSAQDYDYIPGSQFRYGMTSYWILAHLIQTLTGRSHTNFVEEQILGPTKLRGEIRAARSGDSEILEGHVFDETVWNKTSDQYRIDPSASLVTGSGEFVSTPEGLALWVKALVQNQVFQPEAVENMFPESDQPYSMGWMSWRDRRGRRRFWHCGNLLGYSSDLLWLPYSQRTVVILQNQDRRTTDTKLISKIKGLLDENDPG